MTTKILITGGAGYLGSVISERLLAAGYDVTVCDTLLFAQSSLFHLCANPHFHFTFGDVRDETLMARLVKEADVIIPLAAIVGAPACDRDPWMTTSVNLDAIRLITKLRSSDQLLIYPATNSGYGAVSGAQFCSEDTPLNPTSLYGTTKVEAEKAVLDCGNTISLRLATVFGLSARMRLDLLVNHFTYMAATEGYLVIFEKDFRRNFIHIRDFADCFLHCVEKYDAMKGRPYNLGLDEANISKEELGLEIKKQVPHFSIHFSELATDPDKRNYIVSNKRLRDAGFVPKRSLQEGIGELLKGYQLLKRSPMRNV